MLKIISADQRLAEKRGAKILIVGPTGVGKTSLLRTLDPAHVLFIDIEAGDLSVLDLAVDTIRVDDWGTARDIACRIGGPNPSFPAHSCYSSAHSPLVAVRSKAFIDTRRYLSTPFLPSPGCPFPGPTSNPRRSLRAVLRTCGPHTAYTREKC